MRRSVLFLAAALIVAAPVAVYSETSPGTSEKAVKKAAKKEAAPLGANQYASEADARQRCGSDPVVWMNFSSKIYHAAGTRDYGKTKRGAYMCRTDADKSGRPVKGSTPKSKPKT